MKLEVNVTKLRFFAILGAVLILAGAIAIYAYGTSTPSVFGHSAAEIEGVCRTDGTGCPAGVGGTAGKTENVVYYGENCRINGGVGACNQAGASYGSTGISYHIITLPLPSDCANAKEVKFQYFVETGAGAVDPALVEKIPRRGNKGSSATYENPAIIDYQTGRSLAKVESDVVGQYRGTFRLSVQDTADNIYIYNGISADNGYVGLTLTACR